MYSLISGFKAQSKESQPTDHKYQILDKNEDAKRDLQSSNLHGKYEI